MAYVATVELEITVTVAGKITVRPLRRRDHRYRFEVAPTLWSAVQATRAKVKRMIELSPFGTIPSVEIVTVAITEEEFRVASLLTQDRALK